MVGYDAPAFGKFSEVEGENSGGLVVCALQVELADGEGGIRAEDVHFQIRKCEAAHRLAVGIIFVIAIEDRLPAARQAARTDEGGLVGFPVAGHERVNVAAIPCVGLRCKQGANFGFGEESVAVVGAFARRDAPTQVTEARSKKANDRKAKRIVFS